MASGEYMFFQPGKYKDTEDWKTDRQAKLDAFEKLLEAGDDARDDLQLFLNEVCWAVVRSELSVSRAVEFLSKTRIPVREPLQRLFADVLWLGGFVATEANPSREMREEFQNLCSALEKEGVLPRQTFALTLETEFVPPAVCQVATLKKKANQAKTKARYTITRYNLLREHTEGYAKLLFLFDRLASLDFEPKADDEQWQESKSCLVEDIVRLAGFSHMCPNRILSMALDIYEKRLMEEHQNPFAQPLVSLMRRLPQKRLTEVVVFQLLAHGPAPTLVRGQPPPPPPPPPSRPSQFLAVATLISAGLVEMDLLWSYLEPADAVLKQEYADLMSKYDDEVASLGKVDLGSSSSNKDRNCFGRSFQAINQSDHQKLRLVAALISVNCWRSARKAMIHLQSLGCKPCLNHHIRSALCDLLKWLIGPYLRPMQMRLPHQSKPTLDTSFGCVRRFAFGSATGRAEDPSDTNPVPPALSQESEFEQLIPQVRQVLEHLEYFLHTDLHLLTSLWKVLLLYLKSREKAGVASSSVVIDDSLVAIVYRHLLPAASLVPHNPQLSDLMWSVMQQLSVYQRFLIYSCWETMYDRFLLKLAYEKTKSATRQILKRVVANAERKDLIAHQSHFHIAKLCHSNPIPAIETMLRDVEIGFNVNMIQPYIECTNRCPDMTADVMGFVLTRACAKPLGPNRVFLSQADATLSPWLVNLGEFIGRFYKKHPHTDLSGLLSVITKRMNGDVPSEGAPSGTFQKEYKGESLIRIVLENLIEFMGGYQTVLDMNAEQLLCLAGGPRLKSESIAIGKKEDASRKERARQALFSTIVDLGLVSVLWYSFSQQRHHLLSEEFAEAHGEAGGLKLLGLLFDGNHDCFLKLTEFLTEACTREKYMALLPPLQDVFSMFEPALAFLAIRQGLAPFNPALSPLALTDAASSAAPGEAPSAAVSVVDLATTAEHESIVELERVVRMYVPKIEEDGISMKFYITFWRLSLQDILVPIESYEKAIAQISASIKAIEMNKKGLERDRDHTHSRDLKNLKKECARLQDFHSKLKEEQSSHKASHEQVLARLTEEKDTWFLKPSPTATSAFVAEMICPRVLTSYADALFCCHFVRLLIRLRTPGFQLLDFYNSWTIMLTQCIRSCSEREAQIFGVFLREMMSYILEMRRNEEAYQAEMTGNPVYFRNYYEDPLAPTVEYAKFEDIKKGHSKWEGRIYKAMKQGLDSEDWMEKRNALLLLSQCYQSFPVVEKYAKVILSHVENMREKEEFCDVKTLATSLSVKLKHQRERWVDKAPPDEKKKDDVRRPKNSLVPTAEKDKAKVNGGSVDAASGTATAKSGERSPRRAAALEGKAEQDAGTSEKRSRRDADEERRDAKHESTSQTVDKVKDGKDTKTHKESKDPKEAKEGKSRDRGDSKTPKEARDPKDAKDGKDGKDSKRTTTERTHEKEAADKPRTEKEREREKTADRPKSTSQKEGQSSDRKRGSGSNATPGVATPSHAPSGAAHGDERPEKQRRREREGDGGHGATPAVRDRYGGDGGHQPRNALTSSQDTGNSYYRGSGGQPSGHDYRRGGGGTGGGYGGSHGSQRGYDAHRRR